MGVEGSVLTGRAEYFSACGVGGGESAIATWKSRAVTVSMGTTDGVNELSEAMLTSGATDDAAGAEPKREASGSGFAVDFGTVRAERLTVITKDVV